MRSAPMRDLFRFATRRDQELVAITEVVAAVHVCCWLRVGARLNSLQQHEL